MPVALLDEACFIGLWWPPGLPLSFLEILALRIYDTFIHSVIDQ